MYHIFTSLVIVYIITHTYHCIANVCTYFSETEGKILYKKKCIFQNDHVSALLSKGAGLNFLPFLC